MRCHFTPTRASKMETLTTATIGKAAALVFPFIDGDGDNITCTTTQEDSEYFL